MSTNSREALIPYVLSKPGHTLGWRKEPRVGSQTEDWYAACRCGEHSTFTRKGDMDEWAYTHWRNAEPTL